MHIDNTCITIMNENRVHEFKREQVKVYRRTWREEGVGMNDVITLKTQGKKYILKIINNMINITNLRFILYYF